MSDQIADVPTDPRLTDPQVARHVAAIYRSRTGAPPADIHEKRERAQKVRLADDHQVWTRDVMVTGGAGEQAARWYFPAEKRSGTVTVFFHGGGWAMGDLESNDALTRELVARSGSIILSVDYRLAPENPFPAALDDATAALGWLHEDPIGRDADRLVVAGHSAGGNLAAALALRSRDGSAAHIDAQLLMCPVLDCDLDRPSYHEFASGMLLTRDEMVEYWDMYHPRLQGRDHPDLSPLRAESLRGLAPATLIVGGADPLRDEGIAYARRLEADGVETVCHVQPSAPHLFLTFPPMEARDRSLEVAADALR